MYLLFIGQTPVNRPVTFDILTGDRIALQGINGCGKSSLIKLILGNPLQYTGTIERNSRLQISYTANGQPSFRYITTICQGTAN